MEMDMNTDIVMEHSTYEPMKCVHTDQSRRERQFTFSSLPTFYIILEKNNKTKWHHKANRKHVKNSLVE